MTRSPQYKTTSGVGVGSSLGQLRRAIKVQCGPYGRLAKWIVCYYGHPSPGHAATEFLVKRSTKLIAQIRLDGFMQKRR
jgi:hypothetical protein